MSLLLVAYLVVPSPHYFPSYPRLDLSWFAFDWYSDSGWVFYVQYAFRSVAAFIFIGLGTIIPLFLLGLMFLGRRVYSYSRARLCVVLSSVLVVVHIFGLSLTWPAPYLPVQSTSIMLFAVLAYKDALNIKQN
jgi:hypothetical protein